MPPKIGLVKPSAQPLTTLNPRAIRSDGVGLALQALGQTFEGLAEEQQQREDKKERFSAQLGLTKMLDGLDEDILGMRDSALPGAPGHADSVARVREEAYAAYREEFTQNPEIAQVADLQLATAARRISIAEFAWARKQEDFQTESELSQRLETAFSAVRTNPDLLGLEQAEMVELFENSGLPPTRVAELLPRMLGEIQAAAYGGIAERVFVFGEQGEFTSGTASKEGSNASQLLADLTSSVESPAYNIRNGGAGSSGKAFTSFDRHPNVLEHTEDGTPTTAAGRFQINFPTWQDINSGRGFTEALPLPDFGPESQDKAQWFLARQRYAQTNPGKTPDDLEIDLLSGDFDTLANIQDTNSYVERI